MTDKVVVLVTCGTAKEAHRIARRLVVARLAACVNVLDAPVRSIYRWKENVETARERLLLIKTSRKLLPKVEAEVRKLHSYEVPEFLALRITGGSRGCLAWIETCLRSRPSRKR